MIQACTCNTVASGGGIDHRCPIHGIQPKSQMYVYPSGLDGFEEWFEKRGYADDCPSDRNICMDAWLAARGLKYYPCKKCGTWRTEEEGGNIFSMCDDCYVNNNP